MENQSKYNPDRKTVGAIYRDAQINNKEQFVTNGDLTNEVMSSLVEDLNETIQSNPYEGRPFYITVHEKKDLQMPRAILRRMLTSLYRPWPEDDTVVFYVDPKFSDVRFCWCLPHWSEMDNMLNSHHLFNKEMITQIKAWKNFDLYHFGFTKDDVGNWIANPSWKDAKMERRLPKVDILVAS
jgi:hypothetical protein